DLVMSLRWNLLGECVQSFVERSVGLRGEHQPHSDNALDVALREPVDVSKHPAPTIERYLAVHLLVEVEIVAPDHNRANVVLRAQEQQFLDLLARQTVAVVKPGPTGVRRCTGSYRVRRPSS